jgi:alanyl-tRNA synthetase
LNPGYETIIIKVLSRKGKEARLELEETRFHASGGGQPGDTGRLVSPGFSAEVTDCFRDGGSVVLSAKVREGEPSVGLKVRAEVNLSRQALLSRMHSGEHVLSRVLESTHDGLEVYKVAVAEEETTVFMHWNGELGWDLLFEAENGANEVISRDLPVSARFYEPREAREIPGLKANWDRLGDEPIRVVTIPGFDCIACSGTHVSSTGQIGGILVTGYRGTAPEWEVKFTVHRERALDEYSRVMRVLLRKVSCPLDKLEKVYDRLQEEKQALARAMDKVKGMLVLPWDIQRIGSKTLSFVLLPGFLPEMAVPAIKALIEGDPSAIGLVLIPSGEGHEGNFILACGPEAGIDLRDVLKKHPELKARGGGAPGWVNGVTGLAIVSRWVEVLQTEME